ncbi:MAG: hypothetical protein JXA42_07990, partial [Anaerolineales bacterium]|nr:hypothetical protein [Anaerolineales bacterium]
MGKKLGPFFQALLLNLVFVFLAAGCSQAPECAVYGGINVCRGVLDFYRDNGGPDVFGYPITVEIPGDGVVIQYFEKVVIQYPADDPKGVTLRPLGLELSSPTDPELPQSDPDCEYYERYGHHVCLAFYDFFMLHGGVETFGQPISHLMMENGARVQVFENAKFQWIDDQQGRIELADWGRYMCLEEQVGCAENVYREVTGEGAQAPADDVSLAVDRFVEEHGGNEVFGKKIGSLVYAGTVAYQYYQNACFLWTPGRENPISLAELGLLEAPVVSRVPPPEVSDQVQFFPETGHSVILAFLEFYREHGGRDVFGLPLTEYIEEDGQGYQWFENARFEWRPDLPDGQRVQLAPLGELNYYRYDGGLPDLSATAGGELTPQPAEIDLQIFPEHPLLTLGTVQWVTVLARGPEGASLEGVTATLYLQTDAEEQVIVAPPTGADG